MLFLVPIEICLLAGGKYTLDQIEVEDFRDSEEDRRSETFSDLSEPEVGVIGAFSSVDRKGGGCCVMPCPAVTVRARAFIKSGPVQQFFPLTLTLMLSPLLCEHSGNKSLL